MICTLNLSQQYFLNTHYTTYTCVKYVYGFNINKHIVNNLSFGNYYFLIKMMYNFKEARDRVDYNVQKNCITYTSFNETHNTNVLYTSVISKHNTFDVFDRYINYSAS